MLLIDLFETSPPKLKPYTKPIHPHPDIEAKNQQTARDHVEREFGDYPLNKLFSKRSKKSIPLK